MANEPAGYPHSQAQRLSPVFWHDCRCLQLWNAHSISQNPHWGAGPSPAPLCSGHIGIKASFDVLLLLLDANLSADTWRANCTRSWGMCDEFIELELSGWEIGATAAINHRATFRFSSFCAFIQRADGWKSSRPIRILKESSAHWTVSLFQRWALLAWKAKESKWEEEGDEGFVWCRFTYFFFVAFLQHNALRDCDSYVFCVCTCAQCDSPKKDVFLNQYQLMFLLQQSYELIGFSH